jgi:hypothetical protein
MEKKDITVTTKDQSGMPKMVSEIFKHDVYLVREVARQLDITRSKNWEMFQFFVEEYKKASRPKLFTGSHSNEEMLEKTFESALKKTQEFQGGFRDQEQDLINDLIRVAKESPEKFLRAVSEALNDASGKNQLQEPGEEMGQYAFEEILKRMKTQ